MNNIKKIVRNSGFSLIAQVANPVGSFVLVLFIAKYLGVSGIGEFSTAVSLLYIFQAICSLGFTFLITRDVAQNKALASKYLVNAVIIGIIFSMAMIPIMSMVANFITKDNDIIKTIYILSFSLIPYSMALVGESICRAFEKFNYITISQIISTFIKIVLGIILLYSGYSINIVVLSVVLGYLVSSILSIYFAFSCCPEKTFEINWKFCKLIIMETPVFALILVINTIRWNIDTLILGKMLNETEVGYYGAATRMLNVGKIALSCYIVAIQPLIFKLYKESREKFVLICEDSNRYLLMLLVPIAFGTTLLSKRFVLLLFNPDFLPSAYALSILIWILIFSGENLIFANALVASNRQRNNLDANIANVISNIVFNIILIPKFGFIGASISSVMSGCVMFIFQYHFIKKYLFKMNFFRQAIKPILASMAMGIIIYLMWQLNIFILIFIAIIMYVFTLFALKAFSLKDIELLKTLLYGDRRFANEKNLVNNKLINK